MGNQNIELDELVGSYPTCPSCKSRDIVRDAWAEWSGLTREWVLKCIFDEFVCDACGESIKPVWKIDKEFRQKRIRRLNDDMRSGTFRHGTVVMTAGVQALEDELRAAIVDKVSLFEDFSTDSDPHGEHDFGAIEIADQKLFWKIDYFDLKLKLHSPDKANPDVTHRVLTIMLASEY